MFVRFKDFIRSLFFSCISVFHILVLQILWGFARSNDPEKDCFFCFFHLGTLNLMEALRRTFKRYHLKAATEFADYIGANKGMSMSNPNHFTAVPLYKGQHLITSATFLCPV